MPSDAQRRASAAHQARLRAEGWRRVSLWLSPDTLAALRRLEALYGSATEAVKAAIHKHD